MSDKHTTVVSDEELEEMEDHTDWEALQKKTDEEIEQAVREDPDAVLLDEEWFEKAKLVVPASDKSESRSVSMRTSSITSSRAAPATKVASTMCCGPT